MEYHRRSPLVAHCTAAEVQVVELELVAAVVVEQSFVLQAVVVDPNHLAAVDRP